MASKALLPAEKLNLISEMNRLYYEGGAFHDYPRKLALKVMSPDTVDMLEAIGKLNENATISPIFSFNHLI